MEYLPTLSRLLGVVHVNTTKEREEALREGRREDDCLTISVTRDRLVDNEAFNDLRFMVRLALDWYATQEAKRAFERAATSRPIEPIGRKLETVDKVLHAYKSQIPAPVFKDLSERVGEAIKASESEADLAVKQAGLLGALATAGISALAYEHEANRQVSRLRHVVSLLRAIRPADTKSSREVKEAVSTIEEWIERSRAMRMLFMPLLDEESREKETRLKARQFLQGTVEQMTLLLRGIEIQTTDLEPALRLPPARPAEWAAVFQNILLNAANALIDAKDKRISISSKAKGRRRTILLQDTGTGVDLATSDELFRPFVRRTRISPERRELGMGGTGLGLTIVRMVTEAIGCSASFTEPDEGYSTAFSISWKESS
jgi:C4-dicarboxylate-specific signal transduction histidine kinase